MELLLLIAAAFLVIFPVVAIVLAIRARTRARGPGAISLEARIERLEREVERLRRGLAEGAKPFEPTPAAPAPRPAPEPVARPPAPARPARDLEQLIGARWATWVGIVAIVFAVGFLLRWTFQNNLIGPAGRVGLGVAAGLGLLAAGIGLRNRRDIAYLSEGLAGGGLACLYLALFAAHQIYGFLGPAPAFGLMSAVTAAGVFVSVVTGRQATAVLSVLGGLLTPILVTTEHPDERVLLAHLVVLDLLVLGVARFKSWPGLNRLAWVGSVLLCAPALSAARVSPDPGMRLLLLTVLFFVFAAVPVLRPWVDRVTAEPIDLGLVVGNGAAYFAAVYWTLDNWKPAWEAPWAVFLAATFAALAFVHARRVPGDDGAVLTHLGAALVAFSTAIPLAFDGPWVTLGWAMQAAVLMAVAAKLERRGLAVWGGLVLFAMATARVLEVDALAFPDRPPLWNAVFFVGLAVVAALAWGGLSARRLSTDSTIAASGRQIGSVLWFVATMLLAALLWREPTGLWPGGLLVAELLAAGLLARIVADPSLVYAAIALLGVVFARLFLWDIPIAEKAAEQLVNAPLVLRVAACAAAGLSGFWIRESGASKNARRAAAVLTGAGGGLLLLALSLGWAMHEEVGARAAHLAGDTLAAADARLRLQVGLSILWAVYAAGWLAIGFARRAAAIRYAALALLGVTIGKVFLVDMANLEAIYRILSFLVLGLVLLGVSYLYQRRKVAGPSR